MEAAKLYSARLFQRAFADWARGEGRLMTALAVGKSLIGALSLGGTIQSGVGGLPFGIPSWVPAVVFGGLLFVWAPYSLWREEKQRADDEHERAQTLLGLPLDLWVKVDTLVVEILDHDDLHVDQERFWAINAVITNRSGRPVSLRFSLHFEQVFGGEEATGGRLHRAEEYDWWESGKKEPTRTRKPIDLTDGQSTGAINLVLAVFPGIVPVTDMERFNMRFRLVITDTSVRGNPTVEVLIPTGSEGVEVSAA